MNDYRDSRKDIVKVTVENDVALARQERSETIAQIHRNLKDFVKMYVALTVRLGIAMLLLGGTGMGIFMGAITLSMAPVGLLMALSRRTGDPRYAAMLQAWGRATKVVIGINPQELNELMVEERLLVKKVLPAIEANLRGGERTLKQLNPPGKSF